MLSDEWLPRYGLKSGVNGNANGNANANADDKVTTIALPVLCTGELKIVQLKFPILHAKFHDYRTPGCRGEIV